MSWISTTLDAMRGRRGAAGAAPERAVASQTPAAAPATPAEPTARTATGQTIRLSKLCLDRETRRILSDLDLVLDEQRIAILGANGSGKTSLLKLIVGLAAPTSGAIAVDGVDPVRDARSVRMRTGLLFQNAENQIVYPIVREDLAFGLGASGEDVDAKVDAALARLGISVLADRRIHELSGGERQLVALAGVLAREPRTILFDEPTSQLDLANRNRLRDILRALPQQAIVASHDLDLVADFDRALVLIDGRVACDARPAQAIDFYRARCGR